MQLEQRMTTVADGRISGRNLSWCQTSDYRTGLRQRIRVQPVAWSQQRRKSFASIWCSSTLGFKEWPRTSAPGGFALFSPRNRYIQVLHSIKTLAVEMSYAMAEGDWKHLVSC